MARLPKNPMRATSKKIEACRRLWIFAVRLLSKGWKRNFYVRSGTLCDTLQTLTRILTVGGWNGNSSGNARASCAGLGRFETKYPRVGFLPKSAQSLSEDHRLFCGDAPARPPIAYRWRANPGQLRRLCGATQSVNNLIDCQKHDYGIFTLREQVNSSRNGDSHEL